MHIFKGGGGDQHPAFTQSKSSCLPPISMLVFLLGRHMTAMTFMDGERVQ